MKLFKYGEKTIRYENPTGYTENDSFQRLVYRTDGMDDNNDVYFITLKTVGPRHHYYVNNAPCDFQYPMYVDIYDPKNRDIVHIADTSARLPFDFPHKNKMWISGSLPGFDEAIEIKGAYEKPERFLRLVSPIDAEISEKNGVVFTASAVNAIGTKYSLTWFSLPKWDDSNTNEDGELDPSWVYSVQYACEWDNPHITA